LTAIFWLWHVTQYLPTSSLAGVPGAAVGCEDDCEAAGEATGGAAC
jgi:hypothetical protein